jgi:transcriptional regulator with GAF, ATPase, and Fis domain
MMEACEEKGTDRFELPVEWTQSLLLDLAQERRLDGLLEHIVERFAGLPDIALARIWVKRPGDRCDTCLMRDECARNVECLHLVASAGRNPREPNADWSRLDGDFSRFPVGTRKVGEVARSADAIWVEDIRVSSTWIARPDWAAKEGILGFGGQPLVSRGEVLGVLGVFTRKIFCPASLAALRVIADHAAAALANARAFEEIEALRARLAIENEFLQGEIEEVRSFGEMLGASIAIREVGEKIDQVAPTDATVLVLGESGTGKELVAREIHRRSGRADQSMIRVNCASIPRELFESEFFGHEKGAFTGAVKERLGRFCAADGGTLFLDEIGEIPLELQSKLLRVLQEGQYERVGGDTTHTVDVRIIGATNVDLAAEVEAGRFREDLYYRLNVFPIEVPPLRERRDDVPILADHFADQFAKKLKRIVRISEADRKRLMQHDWPGNVRELQNTIERAVILARGEVLRFERFVGGEPTGGRAGMNGVAARESPPHEPAAEVLSDAEMRDREKENLRRALEVAGGRISGAGGVAELLGLKPSTVASRLQRFGLKPAARR